MDRFHVERVPENEGDALLVAQIRKPVPGEDALDGHDEVIAVRCDEIEERAGRARMILFGENRAVLAEMQTYMVRAWRSMPQ